MLYRISHSPSIVQEVKFIRVGSFVVGISSPEMGPVRVIHRTIFFISRELPISSYNVRSRLATQDLDLKCQI